MRQQNSKGFTLVEILLVMVIIGVLAAMVVPKMAGQGKKARIAAARVDIDANLATALDMYELDNGAYPTTEQGLKALLHKPTTGPEPLNWNGPYLKKRRLPKDPWQREYVYVSPGTHNPDEYDLSSYGPDGLESDDDIVNWVDAPED